MVKQIFFFIVLCSVCLACAAGTDGNLQTFSLQEYLQHSWDNEIVHFPVDFPAQTMPSSLELTDSNGKPMPCQFSALKLTNGNVTGTVWTVVSLQAGEKLLFYLREGKPVQTQLSLLEQNGEYRLSNREMAVYLPAVNQAYQQPVKLNTVPAPLLAFSGSNKQTRLGRGTWVNDGDALRVKEARTEVLEQGPVFIKVRYRLTFVDNRYYRADIVLGARQDCVLFSDETDVYAPKAKFSLSFRPGLNANRIFWQNNFYADNHKGLTAPVVSSDKDNIVCGIRPWSFWWLKDKTCYAGFFNGKSGSFVGVIALHPARWSPYGWDGFKHTEIPVTARKGGDIDLSLALLAFKPSDIPKPTFGNKNADDVYVKYCHETISGLAKEPGGLNQVVPMRRELAFTVGNTSEFLDLEKMVKLVKAEEAKRQKNRRDWNKYLREGRWLCKLRKQLIKYSEFPLDTVKDYGFDLKNKTRPHPFLLFSRKDVERARRQAKTVPSVKSAVDRSIEYVEKCGRGRFVGKISKQPDGWKTFYRENYKGNWFYNHAPIAYLGSAQKKFGLILAAGVKGLAMENVDQFLNDPHRPCISGNAHLGTTNLLRLVLAYDTIADSGYLTEEEKKRVEAVLVFGAHVIDHPDYWNTSRGLCSANPNMTSLMKLPLGLLSLFLIDHPKADEWLTFAEEEMKHELKEWIVPGGAWLECPFYQGPSMDGVFLLAQALKNVKGEDHFVDPQFKATMDYFGFILTPPDPRFPPRKDADSKSPMTIPAIGDAMPGHVTPFNGWMAKVTAESDPGFSARQQFYWKGQDYMYDSGGRAEAFMIAICNPQLPTRPPVDCSKSFEGFGNILRNSWTNPRATYVSHRNGYFFHHFHEDGNSIIYYAKGAPLCIDFGTRGAGVWGNESYRHSSVSFDLGGKAKHVQVIGGTVEQSKAGQALCSLPQTIDYSAGVSYGSDGQSVNRHLLLVKSNNLLGANYLIIRDITHDGKGNKQFYWNLWCLASAVKTSGNRVDFSGKWEVDLGLSVLSPANPTFLTDKWQWKAYVPIWKNFSEEQVGVHIPKTGSKEDYFVVLYPRVPGEKAAQVKSLAGQAGCEVIHPEGTDDILLSPGKPTQLTNGAVKLSGEIAFARQYTNGNITLAVVKGKDAAASSGTWKLYASGPTAITVKGWSVEGESDGAAHSARITLPHGYKPVAKINGKLITTDVKDGQLVLDLPAGHNQFTVSQ